MVATYPVAPPEPFNFKCLNEWTKWIRRFERFKSASGLDTKSEEAQVNALLYIMGDNADDIFQSFELSADNQKVYKTVKEKFDSYFVKRRNVIYERAVFNRRKQENEESVETFITALYSLAEHCNYGNLREEMIRDRIVVGVRDSTLSLKLQLKETLTLDEAVTQAREAEMIKKQQPLVRGGQKEGTASVSAIQKKEHKSKMKKGSPTKKVTSGSVCTRCGRSPMHDRQHCPARDAVCHKCSKRGHFKAMCRSSKKVGEVHQETHSEECDYDQVFLGTIGTENGNPWIVPLQVTNEIVDFHIDTGAEVSVIPNQVYQQLNSPPLTPPNQTLRGPSNEALQVKGRFSVKFVRGDYETEQELYVAEGLHKPLLGRPAIESLQLVQRVREVQSGKLNPIQQFPSLFNGLGKLQGEYTIKIQEGATPYSLTTPRCVAIPLMKSVKAELERMETLGVISRVSEPTEWCAGMVVVPKSNGQVRICVDPD